jgi:ribosomal protein S18 acetylase RimI-like enzyme
LPQIFDLNLIQSRLEKDRAWAAYAIADLEPDHVDHASWFCAADGSGLILLYREYPKPILFCIEPSEYLASILNEIDIVLFGQRSRHPGVSGELLPPLRRGSMRTETWLPGSAGVSPATASRKSVFLSKQSYANNKSAVSDRLGRRDGGAPREAGSPRGEVSGEREIVVGLNDAPLIRSLFRITDERRMIRMILNKDHFYPALQGEAVRIGPHRLEQVRELYGNEPPEYFFGHMLTRGVYFGVFRGAELAAMAGTHIVSPLHGIAAIGNVHTRADNRRQGFAGITTSAVSRELFTAGIETIVLNVREDNPAAIHVYERLGFQLHCRYLEMSISPDKTL